METVVVSFGRAPRALINLNGTGKLVGTGAGVRGERTATQLLFTIIARATSDFLMRCAAANFTSSEPCVEW